jgi:hypothetical protein
LATASQVWACCSIFKGHPPLATCPYYSVVVNLGCSSTWYILGNNKGSETGLSCAHRAATDASSPSRPGLLLTGIFLLLILDWTLSIPSFFGEQQRLSLARSYRRRHQDLADRTEPLSSSRPCHQATFRPCHQVTFHRVTFRRLS